MKNIFVMNPRSGAKKKGNEILRDIRDAARRVGADFDVYFTKSRGDARRFVREYCIEHTAGDEASRSGASSEKTRFFGIGGDGTLNELVNGAYGFDNVEIGIIPSGTGNDYVRNYGDPKDFMDIEQQLLGTSRYSDLIHFRGEYKGNVSEGLCANMFNIGFDCNVVDMTERVKKMPLISGSPAYLTSVFITLAKKEETGLLVEYPGGDSHDEDVLLLSIANGCFCGGGIKGVPRSILDDGLMDVSLVHGGISRSFFVRLFPRYMKGTHLEDKRISGKIDYRQERELTVTAKGDHIKLCVDGEISIHKKIAFRVIPKAFRFIVPGSIASNDDGDV